MGRWHARSETSIVIDKQMSHMAMCVCELCDMSVCGTHMVIVVVEKVKL